MYSYGTSMFRSTILFIHFCWVSFVNKLGFDMNNNISSRKKSPTSVKNFDAGAPIIKANNFHQFLDKLEAKYDATIILLATEKSSGHPGKKSKYEEEWFFTEYYQQNGFIVLEKDVGGLMSDHVLAKRKYGAFRFNLSNIACYINMRMSPNGTAFDPEKTPPKQVARECLAECLAFMWETCTTPDGNLKVLEEAEDLEEDLETMKENFEEILKFSDEDLGVKMGTRKDVQAFVEHWYEYISEATDKQEEEDENVTAKGKV